MDGLELQQTLLASLARGLQQLNADRAVTNSGYRYAELTGRIEAMRAMLEFIQSADISPCDGCKTMQEASKEKSKKSN